VISSVISSLLSALADEALGRARQAVLDSGVRAVSEDGVTAGPGKLSRSVKLRLAGS
jgi:hypothetical protein